MVPYSHWYLEIGFIKLSLCMKATISPRLQLVCTCGSYFIQERSEVILDVDWFDENLILWKSGQTTIHNDNVWLNVILIALIKWNVCRRSNQMIRLRIKMKMLNWLKCIWNFFERNYYNPKLVSAWSIRHTATVIGLISATSDQTLVFCCVFFFFSIFSSTNYAKCFRRNYEFFNQN